MRWLMRIGLMVLATGMALAQTSAQNTGPSGATSTTDELKALRDALAQQQQQIAQQQQELSTLQKAAEARKTGVAHVEDAALHTNAPVHENVVQGTERPKESPLSFRIGGTEFTPGGFVDFENIFRSSNATGITGNPTATSFGGIPFSNTVAGHLTEYRATGQYSRWNMKVTGQYGANNVTGYIEGDFNGNDAQNVYVTSNSQTMRLRLYWLDLKRGKWEFLGGQSWGLMTPNRVGVSPQPQDLLITYNEDANIQVGTNYTRSGTFRTVWHPSDNFAWAVAIENPDQFVGSAVTFPTFFNAQLTPQFNSGVVPAPGSSVSGTLGTPNVAPDLVTKMAWDGNPDGRHWHFELGGILTSAKATFIPNVTGATFQHTSKIGGGIQAAFVASMTKNFRMVGNLLYGSGVGRYLIGLGPQVVVFPVNSGGTCTSAGNCGVEVSTVHSGNGLFGFELQATPKTLFGAYYGAAYFQRNAFPDLTSPTVLTIPIACETGGPLQTKPCIGFGGANSANNSNRAIQEGTFDWTQTFWRNPQYGAVLLITQYSYLTRAPWFVAAGAPKNAHASMAFVSLRYVLP